jgi:hypothetical protein
MHQPKGASMKITIEEVTIRSGATADIDTSNTATEKEVPLMALLRAAYKAGQKSK